MTVWARTCPGCGEPFTTNNLLQRRCSQSCSRKRGPRTGREYERPPLHFVGVDGEGVSLCPNCQVVISEGICPKCNVKCEHPEHRYVLLSVGDRSQEKGGRALEYHEIFEFLYDCFLDDPTAAYVGFYLGYDFAQWFRTLPQERAEMLLTPKGRAIRARKHSPHNPTPFPVYVGDWELDILPQRRLKIRHRQATSWLFICDAGSFFQSSFLSAINPAKWRAPIITLEDYAVLERGKKHRPDATLDAEMVAYNVTENRVLSTLMFEYAKGLADIGVQLDRDQWFGPGQAADQWLKSTQCATREDIEQIVPDEVRTAARNSYYGGWFEIRRHGHVKGESYQYDINSAYPYIIARLPCLLHGSWHEGVSTSPFQLVRAGVSGDGAFGPLPHRTPTGQILRPAGTVGWHWLAEIEAAQRAGLARDVAITERWAYEPCDCPPPLRDVQNLYLRRLAVGKDTPTGRAAKLVYNSIYGKFAQSVGHPRWANALYASLITSGCRAQILDAIACHPDMANAVSMVATDSVVFDNPHPLLPISSNLGEWSEKVSSNLTLIRPGIYWDNTSRERIAAGETPELKSRGINACDLARAIVTLDAAFTEWEPSLPWPEMELRVAFGMVTCEQALQRGKWETAGTVTADGTRKLTSDPSDKRCTILHDERGWYSLPYAYTRPMESTPYAREFGAELERIHGDEMMTSDGAIDRVFAEALYGR